MTVHIITPRTLPQKLARTNHPGVRIMLQRARNTPERATARMIECLAAQLAEVYARRGNHA